MTMKLSIVVPVYKSQSILPELVEQIKTSFEEQGLAGQFELILVNDCSPDHSWQVIGQLAKINPFIRGISLRKNFGQHSATMAGLNHARGEVVIIMDDDLQHPPSEITNLMAAINNGADACYTRYIERQHALWKKIGSRFNDWVATVLLDKPQGLYLSSFKALSRELVQEVIKYDGPYAYLDGLILEVTRSIAVVDIKHQARHDGEGNYNLRRSISLWLRMATSFSVFPLRVATFFGFCLAAVSLIFVAVVIVQKLLDPSIAMGWTSLMATVLFVGGVQTFCVGLLGEYLGRTYLRINGKPQFVVRETTWADKS
ncbi:ribonuclease III [Pusillimonas sp. T7-7]|uniref:glycosyltransferase family 2 protein n=1 Tax=Pusillimonas sp. (strain T7-7) TaxID=1007105 RepID=UPI0002084CFA|nr:glycosyltransferase family 2 protein [Pusillimonas sp. T7-7]AEC21726.1 ribonuclease III [Pusillimonas sp. T7-7]